MDWTSETGFVADDSESDEQILATYESCPDVNRPALPRPTLLEACLHVEACRRCQGHLEVYRVKRTVIGV